MAIFLPVMAMISVFAHAQDIITKQDNTTIRALVEEIGDDVIVYRAWDNQGGPIYRISTAKVKMIQFRNGSVEHFSDAQEDSSPVVSSTDQQRIVANTMGRLNYSRGDFSMNGVELDNEQMRLLIGEDIYNQTYRGARKQRAWGKTLSLVGAGVGALGAVAYAVGLSEWTVTETHTWYEDSSGHTWGDKYYYDEDDPNYGLLVLGVVAIMAGSTMFNIGIPLKIIGNRRLSWIADDYNQRNTYRAQLHVGATPNGVGLALRF